MRFSYFNFWIRNGILYIFFCLLGLVTAILDKDGLIHKQGYVSTVLINGIFLFLIAFIQVYLHNRLYQKYFSRRNWRYVIGTLILFGSYFLINLLTPFTFVKEGDVITMSISIFLIYLVGLGFYNIHRLVLEKNFEYRSGLIERDDEIRHLKAQLNPHFLFNALNNLYASSLTAPNQTPDKILELSELLRYQIESSKKELITLREELEFIQKYLNYEQNRNPKLKIEYKKEILSDQISLSPMLFMPFIENAIKYSSQAKNPYIHLDLLVEKKRLHFQMENNFDHNRRKFSGTNTGISNTKKRLELMYRDKHKLEINDENDVYHVDLTLNF